MNEPLPVSRVNEMSSLALAHVGDAVYELMIRSMLASQGPAQVQELHRRTVSYVRAEAQAAAAKKLLPYLGEEELAVYKRGRNCHVHGVPVHANPGEYHSATGLEALFGWLYLQGLTERLENLFQLLCEGEP